MNAKDFIKGTNLLGTDLLLSQTAVAHGTGSDSKWVSGLSPRERAALRSGHARVIVLNCRPWAKCNFREVKYRNGRFVQRLPDADLAQRVRFLLKRYAKV